MINNFEKLNKYLDTLREDEFLFLQVIQRKKEVKDLGSNNRLIKAYFIDSKDKLERYKDEIIKLCEVFNARAYVHLSPRNNERLFSEMLLIMGDYAKSKNFKALSKTFNTACGKVNGSNKLWIIDIDDKDWDNLSDIKNTILKIGLDCKIENVIDNIFETKNGFHLITKPFNPYLFKEKYPDIDIHKNNPTLVFCN